MVIKIMITDFKDYKEAALPTPLPRPPEGFAQGRLTSRRGSPCCEIALAGLRYGRSF